MGDDAQQKLLARGASVRELLKEAIDTARLAMDLAFNAVVYGDDELAREVLKLERKLDELELQITVKTALAVRREDEALMALSLYKLATALNKFTDAAGDLVKAHIDFRADLDLEGPYSNGDEVTLRLTVGLERPLQIADVLERLDVIVDVVAIRRNGRWITEPPLTEYLRKGDVVIVKGSKSAVEAFAEAVKSPVRRHLIPPTEVSVRLLELGKTVNVMYSLALAALLTRAMWLAEYVVELEEYMDESLLDFESKVLASGLPKEEKGALLFAAFAVEHMADAALEIIVPVLEGVEPHPLILDVLDETKERISAIEMDETDEGLTLEDLEYDEKGVIVLAVKRGKRWFIMPPYTDFTLKKGDVLIIKYYEESEHFVEGEESEEDREEIIEDTWEEAETV